MPAVFRRSRSVRKLGDSVAEDVFEGGGLQDLVEPVLELVGGGGAQTYLNGFGDGSETASQLALKGDELALLEAQFQAFLTAFWLRA